jgi:signal transduction histidine kinase
MRPTPRYLGLVVLLAMAGFAAVGFYAIRRDVDNLRVISQDNILWSATQMEVELLRFQLSVADLAAEQSEDSLETVRERFDILWSRVFIMSRGRVGETMRIYDEGHGSLAAMARYLEEVDPILAELRPGDVTAIDGIIAQLHNLQQELRLYTLRVVRADTAASAAVRDRIQSSAQTTAMISVGAVLLSVLALMLILRENRRQRDLVVMTQQVADEAELSSRAKSRFLSMMSHELRNPLNGVLGPLALLDQSDLPEVQTRLVEQAEKSARSMLRMLASLFDYAEMQDGRLKLDREVFGIMALATALREALARDGDAGVAISVAAGTPERVEGDIGRLTQIFVHLAEFVLEMRTPEQVGLKLSHDGTSLVGELAFAAGDATVDWRLDLLTDLGDVAPDQVSADALRPLIARGLISAGRGDLSLEQSAANRRVIRVSLPAPVVEQDKVRVHLETRSAALATIYQAALRSDRVVFVEPNGDSPVDVVLVDSTSVGEAPLMERLRARFPKALFVSLGSPQSPDFFDDVVDTPGDMSSLRESILNRLAS